MLPSDILETTSTLERLESLVVSFDNGASFSGISATIFIWGALDSLNLTASPEELSTLIQSMYTPLLSLLILHCLTSSEEYDEPEGLKNIFLKATQATPSSVRVFQVIIVDPSVEYSC